MANTVLSPFFQLSKYAPLERDTRATDRPLTNPSHDHFQGAPFAKRIAETLISRQSSDSIVVGLYGKWGEAKSTVLNLIRKSLAEALLPGRI